MLSVKIIASYLYYSNLFYPGVLLLVLMEWLGLSIDWEELFYPQTPLLEIIIRGSVVYLGLFFMLRFLAKREVGRLGLADLLVIVLLADAAQNAMAGGYRSITDGLLLVAVIVSWNTLLNFLSFKFRLFKNVTQRPKLLLIKDGKFLTENMRKELITRSELMGEVRLQGVKDVSQVTEAYMESDGAISVIIKDSTRSQPSSNKKKRNKKL